MIRCVVLTLQQSSPLTNSAQCMSTHSWWDTRNNMDIITTHITSQLQPHLMYLPHSLSVIASSFAFAVGLQFIQGCFSCEFLALRQASLAHNRKSMRSSRSSEHSAHLLKRHGPECTIYQTSRTPSPSGPLASCQRYIHPTRMAGSSLCPPANSSLLHLHEDSIMTGGPLILLNDI